jgi:hypothetical protein
LLLFLEHLCDAFSGGGECLNAVGDLLQVFDSGIGLPWRL